MMTHARHATGGAERRQYVPKDSRRRAAMPPNLAAKSSPISLLKGLSVLMLHSATAQSEESAKDS
jgi:hypothetical protein